MAKSLEIGNGFGFQNEYEFFEAGMSMFDSVDSKVANSIILILAYTWSKVPWK